jgi:predicted DNA binding protein
MQKVIVDVNPDFAFRFIPKEIFEPLDRIEGKALLRLDFEKGIKIVVIDMKMKDGFRLDDFRIGKFTKTGIFEILDVLEHNNNTYTCLVKTQSSKNFIKLFRLFYVEDIIYGLPFYFSTDKMVISFSGENKSIRKLLRILKKLNVVNDISFQKAVFTENNLLSCLTERQKEVITTARKSGYYEFPRRINAEELSKKLGISKGTIIEHLRKAENRIMSHITAGY